MDTVPIIRRKQMHGPLAPEEIQSLIEGIASGDVCDSQLSAFTRAVYENDMNLAETVALTAAMRDSGSQLHWQLDGPVVDKHSTGGVGDLSSLILAPLLAACGCYVPMISGRSLGHTGGTVDKLESIPGYQVEPEMTRFRRCVAEVGAAIVAQSPSLAPADRRIYANRDKTATVNSTR